MAHILIFLGLGLFAFSTVVSADESSGRELFERRAVLAAGQVVQGDYFAFGPHVEISGTVHGDVYAAGGDVLVDGTVDGDLIAAGAKVIVSGTVSQDARIAGAQVTVGGTIGRNVTVGGGDVQLTDSARVQGNLLAGAGNVQLAGHIGRDARIGAGNVTVSNVIEGDLAVAAGAVRLTSRATVGRNLRYWSETAPSIDEGAIVRGTVMQRPLPEAVRAGEVRRGLAGIRVMAAVVSFVSTLLLGLLLLRIYPVFTETAASMIRERPWTSFGWGAAALVGTPLLAAVLLATVVGIPIGIMLMALYMVTVYLARVYTITWAGQLALRRMSRSSSLVRAFVTGLVLYSLLSLIPFVGKFVTLGTILLGLGALLATKKELVVRLREQREV
jgi:cytoskeletal protein CcmA (bactofilin family)